MLFIKKKGKRKTNKLLDPRYFNEKKNKMFNYSLFYKPIKKESIYLFYFFLSSIKRKGDNLLNRGYFFVYLFIYLFIHSSILYTLSNYRNFKNNIKKKRRPFNLFYNYDYIYNYNYK